MDRRNRTSSSVQKVRLDIFTTSLAVLPRKRPWPFGEIDLKLWMQGLGTNVCSLKDIRRGHERNQDEEWALADLSSLQGPRLKGHICSPQVRWLDQTLTLHRKTEANFHGSMRYLRSSFCELERKQAMDPVRSGFKSRLFLSQAV